MDHHPRNGQPGTDPELEEFLASLPAAMQRVIRPLLRPGLGWVRVPVAILLIVGGFAGFLPILGFWMLPLGLLLLAQDVPFLRAPTLRGLKAVRNGWHALRRRLGFAGAPPR